jgi:DNA-binding transcriptional LysR family regulator
MTASFNSLDLNLLRVFDAVMEERSVLRASQRIFLSQSAVSHSLARLRDLLGDDLFVRTSSGMQPTARAIAMAPAVRDALQKLELAIGPPKFEPSMSRKMFTIAASDFITMVVAPQLLALLEQEAPNIDIVIRPGTRIDLAEQIDLGRIDAAVGTFADVPQRLKSNLLFEYDDVLVTCAAFDPGKLTTEKLSSLSLIIVSLGGDKDGAVDGFISERGLARRSEMYDRAAFERAYPPPAQAPRIAVCLPHFLAVPALLQNSQLVAVIPRPLAETFARSNPLSIHQLPYSTLSLNVHSIWHERNEADASHHWLHTMLHRATAHLRTGSNPKGLAANEQ